MTERMGAEEKNANERTNEKKSGKIREALKKAAKPLVEGAVAVVAVVAISGCALDLDGKGKFQVDANIDVQEEQVEDSVPDIEADVPEEIEDVDIEGEDVSVEDVTGEDPIEEDPAEEDPAVDVVEEDAREEDPIADVAGEDPREDDPIEEDPVGEEPIADVIEEDPAIEDMGGEDGPTDVDADEVELPECDPIVTAPTTIFISTGTSTTVGNITVEYTGLTGTDGTYVISCDGSYVGTLYIAQTGRDSLDLGGGYAIDIRANVVGTHGSNVTIEITGP